MGLEPPLIFENLSWLWTQLIALFATLQKKKNVSKRVDNISIIKMGVTELVFELWRLKG